MLSLFNTKIGRLRLLGYAEGVSLLVLVFVAVPLKHLWGNGRLSTLLGPIHGALFVLFLLNTLSVGVEQRWTFRNTTWKILLACFIPFGTFYIDRVLFRKIQQP